MCTVTHQLARGRHPKVYPIVCPKVPHTFRKIRTILVQVKFLGPFGGYNSMGREGDRIVARGDAGEDAGVQFEEM